MAHFLLFFFFFNYVLKILSVCFAQSAEPVTTFALADALFIPNSHIKKYKTSKIENIHPSDRVVLMIFAVCKGL